ncbi:MAG: hypothetical protein R3C59_07805 [Planctomycetaceae bacterium]
MNTTIERPDTVDRHLLDGLTGSRDSLCVSIFIPTHRCGTEVQQDPIRLKNAVKRAKSQLVEFGMPEEDADQILQPAAGLSQEDASSDFWQHQSDGLALLLSEAETVILQLPVKFGEQVSVSDRFALKPLILAQTSNEQFHVVAVSRNGVRVFRGCASGLDEEQFDGLPSGLEEIVSDDQQKGHNRHSFKVRANSGDSSVPHGHVETSEDAHLKRYFREIKDVIGDDLQSHHGPVVFAGVNELLPYFKDEFDCCDVIDEAACGNAEHLNPSDLHNKVWPLVEKRISGETQKVVERYQEAAGMDHGITDLKTVLAGAYRGQIDTLLLKADERNYGTCDNNGQIERCDEEPSAETYDLFDIAAICTLQADGKVVFVNDDDIASPIAAILRYVA